MTPPPPDLAERFRRDFERVLGRPVAPDERFALAVSGGADSMAMLALAAAAHPGAVLAATVDHRLRPESADEAAMVARVCGGLRVPHATLPIEAPKDANGNLHAWARQERYALLQRWATDSGSPTLSTAHHADDQAETFLMRAARASGLSGLAAVRERILPSPSGEGSGAGPLHGPLRLLTRPTPTPPLKGRGLMLVRPLLRWRRRELRAVAEASALPFVDDPSNADLRFDRTRFRAWLEQADWIDPVRIGRSAEHLAEADADMCAISHWLWSERALPSGDFEARFDVRDLPRGVRRRLARIGIEHVLLMRGGGPTRAGTFDSIEPLLDALDAGGKASQGPVLASAHGTVWHFREAPPRRPPPAK